jgi:hypothetical protein
VRACAAGNAESNPVPEPKCAVNVLLNLGFLQLSQIDTGLQPALAEKFANEIVRYPTYLGDMPKY